MSKLYVGTVGWKVRLDALTTLPTTAVATIFYKNKIGDIRGSFPAVIESDRYVSYTTLNSSDLRYSGEMYLQGEIDMPGYHGKTEIVRVRVYPAL